MNQKHPASASRRESDPDLFEDLGPASAPSSWVDIRSRCVNRQAALFLLLVSTNVAVALNRTSLWRRFLPADMCTQLAFGSQIRIPSQPIEEAPISHGVVSAIALQVNDRALSKRERGRSRSPHRDPIGPPPRARVDRPLWEREGND